MESPSVGDTVDGEDAVPEPPVAPLSQPGDLWIMRPHRLLYGDQTGASATKRTGKVLNDDHADWSEAWALFPADIAYVWHGTLHAAVVAESQEISGFAIRSQMIWAK